MQSPASQESLHTETVWHAQSPCPAINDRVSGLAVCSLTSSPHSTHQLLCEETGELLGEWTDSDPAFRKPSWITPTHTPGRQVALSDRPDIFGDAA